jgi:hypothetical protein
MEHDGKQFFTLKHKMSCFHDLDSTGVEIVT